MEGFFHTVSFILADQLRHVIRASVQDFLILFNGNLLALSQQAENAKPLQFTVRLTLEETKIRFDPPVNEIQTVIEGLFDAMLLALDKVPKIETQLFFSGQNANINNRAALSALKPEQCVRIGFEATFPQLVADAQKSLKAHISNCLQLPVNYLSDFDKHKSVINRGSDNEVTSFLQLELTQDRIMEEVRRYRTQATSQILCGYPFSVNFPLVLLHCEEFIKDLSDRANGLGMRILDKMAGDNRMINSRCVKAFQRSSHLS